MDEASGADGAGGWGPDEVVDLRAGAPAPAPASVAAGPIGDGPPTDVESDTRARLVRAAAEVFTEKGYTGTRVVDIARRAGFTSGALYGYFDSRAALLAEAIAVESDRLLAAISDGLGEVGLPMASETAETLAQFVSFDFSATDQLLLDGLAICPREAEAQVRIGGALRRLAGQFEDRLRDSRARPGSHLESDHTSVSFLLLVFLLGSTAVRAAGLQDVVPDGLEPLLESLLGHLGVEDGADVEGLFGGPA